MKLMRPLGTGFLAILMLPFLTAVPAAAEWFTDVYLGVAVTHTADVSVKTGGTTTTQDVQYGSSVNPGVRVGRWFETTPWLGLAVDASYFGPQSDLQVVPISALIMARLALMKSEDHPEGFLRPYAAVGPGLFISHIDGNLASFRGVSDTSVELGVDVRLGVAMPVQDRIALFTEYRFTHVSPTFSFDVAGGTRKPETTFNTHHIVVGVSFKF